VVPQPVYMNMSDLSSLSAAHREQQLAEESSSPDLKTPTAEDLGGCLGSDGSSSSGYGSQIMAEPLTEGKATFPPRASKDDCFVLSNHREALFPFPIFINIVPGSTVEGRIMRA
jgi:hypothetical protein